MPPVGWTFASRNLRALATVGSSGERPSLSKAVAARAVMPTPARLVNEPSTAWPLVERNSIPLETIDSYCFGSGPDSSPWSNRVAKLVAAIAAEAARKFRRSTSWVLMQIWGRRQRAGRVPSVLEAHFLL